MIYMNSANEMLQAIKNKKTLLKNKLELSDDYTEEQYNKDIEILNKEEREWLEQFDDVPVNEIYKEDQDTMKNTENAKADIWQEIIKDHLNKRKEEIELRTHIREAMVSYLQTVSESEDFELKYSPDAVVELNCKGDLFDLEQIGGFCEVFGLDIIVNSRVVVENYQQDYTETGTNYLFQYKNIKEIKKDAEKEDHS